MLFRPDVTLELSSLPCGTRRKRVRAYTRLLAIIFMLAAIDVAGMPEAKNRPPLYDGADGATCDYYNYGAKMPARAQAIGSIPPASITGKPLRASECDGRGRRKGRSLGCYSSGARLVEWSNPE